MQKAKKVFITGSTGYVGRNVARAFRRAGYHVLGLTRDAGKAAGLAAEEIAPVVGDLQEPAAWRGAAEPADVLVHAAVDYDTDTMALDQASVKELIGIARARGATLIYTSGVWVHGDTAGTVADENSPLAPIPMVAARVETERLVLAAPGVRGIVIRPGIVYGRQGGLTASFFDEQPVAGDGSNHWPMVHVDDLAEAYVRAAERGNAGSVYIVTDRSRATVRELVSSARAAAGLGDRVRWIPLAEARRSMGPLAEAWVLDQQLSAARAERELEWRPRHPGFAAEARTYAAANRKAGQWVR